MDRQRRQGFTLIEMLLAAALASLLALACSQIAGLLFRSRRGDGRRSQPAWVENIWRLMARDLAASLSFRAGTNSLTLLAHRSLDPRNSPTRLSLIEYRAVKMDERWLLLRDERPPEELATKNSRREILALGISSFRVDGGAQSSGESGNRLPSDKKKGPPLGAPDFRDLQPLPGTLSFTLLGPEGRAWRREITLR